MKAAVCTAHHDSSGAVPAVRRCAGADRRRRRPLRLTLDEPCGAVSRRAIGSPRRSRAATPPAPSSASGTRRAAQVAARPATRAPTTSSRSASRCRTTSFSVIYPGHSRQLSARGSTCSGRSTRAAGSKRSSALRADRGGRRGRRDRGGRAPISRSRSRARSGRWSRPAKRCAWWRNPSGASTRICTTRGTSSPPAWSPPSDVLHRRGAASRASACWRFRQARRATWPRPSSARLVGRGARHAAMSSRRRRPWMPPRRSTTESLDALVAAARRAAARARRAGRARRCGRRARTRGRGGRHQADDRGRRRRRLRAARTRAFFRARERGATSWDASVNVELAALRRRTRAQRDRRGRGARRARPRRGSPSFDASLARGDPAAPQRDRRRAARPSTPPRTAFAARPKRAASSASGSRRASRPAPTCSMRRSRCCRPSSIARRPLPTRGSADARPGAGPRATMNAIAVTDLTRRFGDFVAVDQLTFEVASGRDLRLPRQQRRREVHDDPHAVRAAEADRAGRRRSAASTSAATRKASSAASATCRSGSRCTSG